MCHALTSSINIAGRKDTNDQHFRKLLYGETLGTFHPLFTPSTSLQNTSIIQHVRMSIPGTNLHNTSIINHKITSITQIKCINNTIKCSPLSIYNFICTRQYKGSINFRKNFGGRNGVDKTIRGSINYTTKKSNSPTPCNKVWTVPSHSLLSNQSIFTITPPKDLHGYFLTGFSSPSSISSCVNQSKQSCNDVSLLNDRYKTPKIYNI